MTDAKPLASIKHLLIDLDGTLLEARNMPLRIDFVTRTLNRLKTHGRWSQVLRAFRAVKRELESPSPELTNYERAALVFAKKMGLPPEDGRIALKQAIDHIFPKLERHFYPRPGAVDFLKWAQARYPMTLATNPVWEEEIIKLRLKWAGVDPAFFNSITHAARMRACKPHRQYYEEILAQEKLRPEECLLVGDDLKNDLPAARAGIRVFILSKKEELRPLKSPAKKVPAWQGSYKILRSMLE